MFYKLEYIGHHPCGKMQEVIESFFREAIDSDEYGIHLFPLWFRKPLGRSDALKKGFNSIFDYLHEENRDRDFRQIIYAQAINNNRIQEICESIDFDIQNELDWESELGKKTKDFFMKNLYASLDSAVFRPEGCSLRPKKSFYNEFIKKNKYICPFCGIGHYPNPRGNTRSDLDHYLNKADFPFSAANLKNLVPMCDACNQDYKQDKSMIAHNGNRTPAFYPYGEFEPNSLIIQCSKEAENDADQAIWEIILHSDDQKNSAKIDTWDRVFAIKNRIREEVEEFYEFWMKEFYIDEIEGKNTPDSLVAFKELLETYSSKFIQKIKIKPQAIIQKEFFRFMAQEASDIFLKGYLRSFVHQNNEQAA